MRVCWSGMQRSLLGVAAVLSTLTCAGVAFAWSQAAEIEVKVHEHAFNRVKVESTDCVLRYQLWFTAPAAVYSSGAASRNVYRFRASIDFLGGKSARVPLFANRGAGERVWEYRFDTAPEGCWAKDSQKLQRVRVEACRGEGCTPDPVK